MSRKRTGGGLFDPTETPTAFAVHCSHFEWELVATNDVMTDAAAVARIEAPALGGRRILLDSGIFAMASRHARAHNVDLAAALKVPPDQIDGFDELFPRYVELVQRYAPLLWGFIELDQGGRDAKRATRARLEAALGMTPIPVYHPDSDGWDYFDELAEGYDRLCVGNLVQAGVGYRTRMLHTLWERRRDHEPGLWIHALGVDMCDDLFAAPVDSCDSTSWQKSLRWPWGVRVSSMLEPFGHTSRDLQYQRGQAAHAPAGMTRAEQACAWEFRSSWHNWREHAAALERELGPAYPARLPGEPAACPASTRTPAHP